MNDVSIRIKNARKKRKLTQEELGELLFVSDKTISSWESGRTIPDIESINKISNVLDISFLSLLYGDINLNNIEIEVKFKVSKLEYNQLLHYIDKESVKISEEIQNDYYYVSDYFHEKEWIRIRNINYKNIMTYKRWYQNKYCDEYEVYVDNVDNLQKIINVLGAKLLVSVKKDRIKYLYKNQYLVLLDNVYNLGPFVEIEILNPDISNPLLEYDKLIEIAKELNININNLSDKRYPEYFL